LARNDFQSIALAAILPLVPLFDIKNPMPSKNAPPPQKSASGIFFLFRLITPEKSSHNTLKRNWKS